MPKVSIYQKKKKERLEHEAFQYYQQGLTTRQVSSILKELGTPKSHQWVAEVARKYMDKDYVPFLGGIDKKREEVRKKMKK